MEILKSPAKINIGLWVTNKRPDGYHEIYTIFHTLELHDRIFIKPAHIQKVQTSTNIPQEENIVFKTLKKFEEWTGIIPQFEIFIEKNIPIGAGLGGGSSNAATVLKYINEYYENPLSEEELFQLAASIGADVPFFLKGGMAIGEGIGDKLQFMDKTFSDRIFIIYPGISIPTGEIYQKVTPEMLTKKEDIHIIDSLTGDFERLLDRVENTLGKIVERDFPQVKEVINTLRYLGYKPVISGSGSSVYAIGEPSEELNKICQIKGWKLIKTYLK